MFERIFVKDPILREFILKNLNEGNIIIEFEGEPIENEFWVIDGMDITNKGGI